MGDDVADVVAGCAVLMSEVQNVLPPGVQSSHDLFLFVRKELGLQPLNIAQMTFYIPA